VGDNDSGVFHYNCSFACNSLVDKAMIQALKHVECNFKVMSGSYRYSDDRQFNGGGVRVPFGALMRTPPGQFRAYHSSRDDLGYVKPEILLKTLEVCWKAVMALERAFVYKAMFTVEPFLTAHGIYPFDLGAGEGTALAKGEEAKRASDAFYYLMWNVDGKMDLLDIAERAGLDVEIFDRPVGEFLRTGLIARVPDEERH
jgi:aminopeptidase-like protein